MYTLSIQLVYFVCAILSQSLLNDVPTKASVRTTSFCELMALHSAAFHEVLRSALLNRAEVNKRSGIMKLLCGLGASR